MGLEFKVNLTRKFKVNGKEYASLDEVPEEFRGTIRKALDGSAGGHKIMVNGAGYDSPGEMPPDTRRLYEEGLEKARLQGSAAAGPQPARLAPEGALSWRTIFILVLAAGLILLAKYFSPK